jgi:hypothetical protein
MRHQGHLLDTNEERSTLHTAPNRQSTDTSSRYDVIYDERADAGIAVRLADVVHMDKDGDLVSSVYLVYSMKREKSKE